VALVLFLVLLVVPVAELWVIVSAAEGLGVLPTIALLVLVSVLGAWLVKREGMGVLRRMTSATGRGEPPTDELVDGALVAVAGLLLLTPGFLTDALGLALLVPPVRRGVRRSLVARFRRRLLGDLAGVGGAGPVGFAWSGRVRRVDVGRAWIDAEGGEVPRDPGRLDPGGEGRS
jgi:UPF0716 protein FxsA